MQKGFSLVELLVVVSIIAIMSVGAVVGFGRFGQVIDNQQVIAFIKDEVKRQELRVLSGQFKEVNIYFMPNYLVVDEVYNQDLEGMTLSTLCDDAGIRFTANGILSPSSQGPVISITADPSDPDNFCFNFNNSADREIFYSFRSKSSTHGIRFIHFNVNRENLLNSSRIKNIKIGAGPSQVNTGQIRLRIESPYLKKTYFNSNDAVTQPIVLFLESTSDDSVSLPLTLVP